MRRINWSLVFWIGLVAIMFIRVFYFGFSYFNYLDDNNTYGVFFRRNGDIWNDIIMWYGLYTFRPIAFFSDAYITQWFWPRMELVLLFYTAMSFITMVLFKEVLRKSGMGFGVAGLIVCVLVPLNIEAVYWIGASTRFVPGMFFSILSCYVLVRFLDRDYNRKNLMLFLYFIFNIIATGFYEQIIVFNFVFTLIIIALNFRKLEYDRTTIVAAPFVSLVAICAYYIAFWNHGTRLADRGAMVSEGYISHFIGTGGSIWRLLTTHNFNMIGTGFFGFFDIAINLLQVLALAFALIFALLCGWRLFSEEPSDNMPFIKILGGIILAIAPFAPFFLLENNFMAFRNVYPSVFGIAMVIDGISEIITRTRLGRMIAGFGAAIACLVFFLASITEINNYRLIEIDDHIIAQNFLAEFSQTGFDDQGQIIVFNTRHRFTDTSREGFENISSSDWAFLGKLNAHSEEFYFASVLPIVEAGGFNMDILTDEVLLLGMDEYMNVIQLNLRQDRQIYDRLGRAFGQLLPYEDRYIFEKFN
ncbi:MAG: hypothetical protein FWE24_06655 [Defluviitaleaceae bacterium]|nr:hypothetical protein [Defluviitaleaceae bacterium]